MSNSTRRVEQECTVEEARGDIELTVQPRVRDIGEFSVRRLLPSIGKKKVGPWVFFDHMGPVRFPAEKGIDVRPHPHINLATVSYLFEGEMLHRDSLGSVQIIRPGDINLMVAGSGIVHSERELPEVRNTPHALHGLQLWLALPEKEEEIDPAFFHYSASEIPHDVIKDVRIRVMMGSAYGMTSPVKTFAETLYVEAHLEPGQLISIPNADERAVYVAAGRLQVGDTTINQYALAVIANTNDEVSLRATEESRIAVIGGEKMGQRFIEWNFVSSRKERIEQAKTDWKENRFPTIPGDDKEFIPLPE